MIEVIAAKRAQLSRSLRRSWLSGRLDRCRADHFDRAESPAKEQVEELLRALLTCACSQNLKTDVIALYKACEASQHYTLRAKCQMGPVLRKVNQALYQLIQEQDLEQAYLLITPAAFLLILIADKPARSTSDQDLRALLEFCSLAVGFGMDEEVGPLTLGQEQSNDLVVEVCEVLHKVFFGRKESEARVSVLSEYDGLVTLLVKKMLFCEDTGLLSLLNLMVNLVYASSSVAKLIVAKGVVFVAKQFFYSDDRLIRKASLELIFNLLCETDSSLLRALLRSGIIEDITRLKERDLEIRKLILEATSVGVQDCLDLGQGVSILLLEDVVSKVVAELDCLGDHLSEDQLATVLRMLVRVMEEQASVKGRALRWKFMALGGMRVVEQASSAHGAVAGFDRLIELLAGLDDIS